MNNQLNILLLEDEQRAGQKLMDLIKEVQPLSNVSWERTVADGMKFLETTDSLDLIFSDIELLDGNAFQIYERIRPTCPIIFCTAYDRYYTNAFNANGIAYLLKPYSKEMFLQAWEKYKLLFGDKNQTISPPTPSVLSAELLSKMQSLMEGQQKNYKSTFSVKKPEGVFLLKTENVAYFQAQGDFVLAFDNKNNKHIINYSLSKIEGYINPKRFFRINRSEIVNINSILKYNSYTKNRLAISLSQPNTVLYTTNSRTPDFRNWIEGL